MKLLVAASFSFLVSPTWTHLLDNDSSLQGWNSNATLSHRFAPAVRAISGRQITTFCATAGWIPCTAYPSNRGCRPPGGTCCLDGNYCASGNDCVNIIGQTRNGCCARNKTCTNTTRQCKSGGSSLCPEGDYCCAAEYVCGHAPSGGSSCNRNFLANSTTTPTPLISQAPAPIATLPPVSIPINGTITTTTASLASNETSIISTSSASESSSTPFANQSLSTNNTNTWAIAGSVIGAVVVFCLVAFAVLISIRRKRALDLVRAAVGDDRLDDIMGAGSPNRGAAVMESRIDAPPLVPSLRYSGTPEIQSEPDIGTYVANSTTQGDPNAYPAFGVHSTHNIYPNMTAATPSMIGNPLFHPATTGAINSQFSLPPGTATPESSYPSYSTEAEVRYGGTSETPRGMGQTLSRTNAPPSPTQRFTAHSENSGLDYAVDGLYYNNTPVPPPEPHTVWEGAREAIGSFDRSRPEWLTTPQGNANNNYNAISDTFPLQAQPGPSTALATIRELGPPGYTPVEEPSSPSGSGSAFGTDSPGSQKRLLYRSTTSDQVTRSEDKGTQWY